MHVSQGRSSCTAFTPEALMKHCHIVGRATHAEMSKTVPSTHTQNEHINQWGSRTQKQTGANILHLPQIGYPGSLLFHDRFSSVPASDNVPFHVQTVLLTSLSKGAPLPLYPLFLYST